MSTQHIVHKILEPGLPGDGFTAPEATTVRRKLETVRAISADWYSDLNDAITEAGVGGIVSLSPGVEYVQDDPLRPLNNLTIQGDSRFGSVIKYTGAAGIQHATPGSRVEGLRVFNVTLDGNEVGGMGIDARGWSQCHFDMVRIWNPTDHGIWWGGDTDEGGWTNTFTRGLVRAPLNGAAMYFKGRTTGGTGAATANNILVESSVIYSREGADSFAVKILSGESNVFTANDGGYGRTCGAMFYLEGLWAQRNRFISNRTENVRRVVQIHGGARYNTFMSNIFGLDVNTESHGAEIHNGLRNTFKSNYWEQKGLAPRVWEAGGDGGQETFIDDHNTSYTHFNNTEMQPTGTIHNLAAGGSVALATRVVGDARERFYVTADGTMSWRNPATGGSVASLIPTADGIGLQWSDNAMVKIPRGTSIPAASAAYRGVMIYQERTGTNDDFGPLVCIRLANGTYAWKRVSLV